MSFRYYSPTQRPEICFAKGLLTFEDYGVLYGLGRAYAGKGLILDLGAFCGASAHAMGLGIRDSDAREMPTRPIHSFDLFEKPNAQMGTFIKEHFYERLFQTGSRGDDAFEIDDFLSVFEYQTGMVEDLIEVHRGSILEFRPDSLGDVPFETLNIDLAKSFPLYEFIVRTCFPRMLIGGLIFQQDINIPDHWYLLVSMKLLQPYWSLAHVSPGAGWVFSVESRPEAATVEDCIETMRSPSPETVLNLHGECLEWYPDSVSTSVDHALAFWYYDQFGTDGFAGRDAFLSHFRVKEKGYHARRLSIRMSR